MLLRKQTWILKPLDELKKMRVIRMGEEKLGVNSIYSTVKFILFFLFFSMGLFDYSYYRQYSIHFVFEKRSSWCMCWFMSVCKSIAHGIEPEESNGRVE